MFFIVGRERSGTTLLRFLFDAHPQVNIPIEFHFIWLLFHKYHRKKVWSEKALLQFFEDLCMLPRFGFMSIDAAKLRNDLLKCEGNNSFGCLCKVVLSNYISVYEKEEITLFGDKSPFYALQCKQLLTIFPEAKFIHITRDHRDNMLSMKRVKFEASLLTSLVYRWKYYNDEVLQISKQFPERFVSVRYEDLVDAPSEMTARLCSFLGIRYEPSVLEFNLRAEQFMKRYPVYEFNRIHGSLFKPISTGGIGGWKNKMSANEVKRADAVAGKTAETLGYELQFPKPGLFTKLRVLPGKIYGRLYYVYSDIAERLPLKVKIYGVYMPLARIFKRGWYTMYKKKKMEEARNGR